MTPFGTAVDSFQDFGFAFALHVDKEDSSDAVDATLTALHVSMGCLQSSCSAISAVTPYFYPKQIGLTLAGTVCANAT